MALLTDRLAESVLQIARIVNGVVNTDNVLVVLVPPHVQFAGTMTAFAADCSVSEDRQAMAVGGVRDVLHLVSMAEQAIGSDRPAEVRIIPLVSRRQVP